jgi:hypothetical protein
MSCGQALGQVRHSAYRAGDEGCERVPHRVRGHDAAQGTERPAGAEAATCAEADARHEACDLRCGASPARGSRTARYSPSRRPTSVSPPGMSFAVPVGDPNGGVAHHDGGRLGVATSGDHQRGRGLPALVQRDWFEAGRVPRVETTTADRGGLKRFGRHASEEQDVSVSLRRRCVIDKQLGEIGDDRHTPFRPSGLGLGFAFVVIPRAADVEELRGRSNAAIDEGSN